MGEGGPRQAPKGVRIFDRPMVVRRAEATRFLWGDPVARYVSDLIYGRSERLAGLIFTLGPGEFFRSSETWRPLYDQDRYYFVVSGELTIQDPETGDVATARAGEALYWRGARYHFGYNFGSGETHVLDWYAPQERPAHVPEIEASPGKRPLRAELGGRFDLLARWPAAAAEDRALRAAEGRLVRLTEADALGIVHGRETPVLMTLYASSPHLTAGTFRLRPSVMAEAEAHPGEEVVFALEGRLHVYLPDSFDWFELDPLDCLFLPEGTRHHYCNKGAEPARAAFCVTPGYR